ncbi:MAG: hypothetical protein HY801_07815, partial [Candidatus Lindowbacteria bacterium]|nr:hypothetical protein [Candidatus Lindowbacteria bacterium]
MIGFNRESLRKVLKSSIIFCVVGIALAGSGSAIATSMGKDEPQVASPKGLSQESQNCVECHKGGEIAPVIVSQWQQSAHARSNVGCYECHKAESSDTDAFEHYETTISIIVSPKD